MRSDRQTGDAVSSSPDDGSKRAATREGVGAAPAEAGTFGTRTCKLCGDGIVVKGEYGITNVLLGKGLNVATLMSRYAPVGPPPPSKGAGYPALHPIAVP